MIQVINLSLIYSCACIPGKIRCCVSHLRDVYACFIICTVVLKKIKTTQNLNDLNSMFLIPICSQSSSFYYYCQ